MSPTGCEQAAPLSSKIRRFVLVAHCLLGSRGLTHVPAAPAFFGNTQVPLYAFNQHLVFKVLQGLDMGGSITIHAFGAYYGLAASLMLSNGRQVRGGVLSAAAVVDRSTLPNLECCWQSPQRNPISIAHESPLACLCPVEPNLGCCSPWRSSTRGGGQDVHLLCNKPCL